MNAGLAVGVDIREWKKGSSTGIGRVLTSFLGWASANTDFRFVLVGNQDSEVRVEPPRCAVRLVPETKTLLWDHRVLPRILRQEKVDVFWSPYYKAPVHAPCPTIITIHDLIPFVSPRGAFWAGTPRTSMLRWWMKFLAMRATRIVTDSAWSKTDLIDVLGIAEAKIAVIPVGLEASSAAAAEPVDSGQFRTRYALPPAYTLYLGHFHAHKNVDTLIESWKLVPESLRQRFPLVLAGGGNNSIGADTENIVVPGFIEDADLAALYRGARAFAFPSCYEGFGLPPLEAMAHGVPVACSNAASLPEVTGNAAILVDPLDRQAWADALEQVLTDDHLRQELIERGLQQAGTFAPWKTAPLLAELLVEVGRGVA